MKFNAITLAGMAALCLGAAAPAWAGSYTYTTLPISSVNTVYNLAINDNDQLVGAFDATSGGQIHGFFWSGGTLTQVDYPNAISTGLVAINNSGLAVGYYDDTTGVRHPIAYNTVAGTFTALKLKGPSLNDAATGVNSAGQIVGINQPKRGEFSTTLKGKTTYFRDKEKHEKVYGLAEISDSGTVVADYVGTKKEGYFSCYVYSNGQGSNLQLPGAPISCGINSSGTIFGILIQDRNYLGYVYANGATTILEYPGAFDTTASGVNSAGEIVGVYNLQAQPSEGFIQINGTYYTVNAPNSISTSPFGINALDSLTGFYEDQNNAYHVYLAQCPQGQQPCTQ